MILQVLYGRVNNKGQECKAGHAKGRERVNEESKEGEYG
jgi:hypothetical protein